MKNNNDTICRCEWCGEDPLYVKYHDEEWGRPVEDDRTLFEFLVLESAQAGLSWITILKRREGYRKAFAGFNPHKVAEFTPEKVDELVKYEGIIRHRRKIETTITNARLFLEVQKEFGSFRNYILSFFPDGEPVINYPEKLADIPVSTPVSDAISKNMRKRGFLFFGTTICYAFLQAVGFVDDHIKDCRFKPTTENL